jgi:acetylornithine deacetylase/succinyl-diaminopimelate desuccinylase-like protein
VEVQELPGRTPLLLIDVPPAGSGRPGDTVLLYGHLDKQPPFTGWREGLGPWEPVIEGDRLYGRGGADDGYSTFSALTALEAVRAAGGSHSRAIVLIEASEESGSPDLPAHLEALGDRLGSPSLVIALDSWCGDWDRLWTTTSLRGLLDMVLEVEVLTEGVHSGMAGGVVPSSFRILRELIGRIEDVHTGHLIPRELHVDIPDERLRQIAATAHDLGDFADRYPFAGETQPVRPTTEQLLIARTWEPSLEVVGISGAPLPEEAGNVLRPRTAVKLSIRVPPTADAAAAADAVERWLTADPPYGAHVTVRRGSAEPGWHAPPDAPWLARAVERASVATFGQPARSLGEGGTIPFMGMLGARFPAAQFLVTGLLGPGSNAHGPNEFLHLPTARKLTAAVAHVLDAHAQL